MFKKIFSAIFGSPSNTEKVIDGARSGLDKLFYTDEEKADTAKEVRAWFLKYLEATQPQNLARRFIALIIVSLWAFLCLFGAFVYYFNKEYGQFIFETLAEVVMNPFLLVVGFYFLTHTVRAYKKG